MNWLSRCQPSSVNEGVWTTCITAMGEAFENTIYHAKGASGAVTPTRIEVTITTYMIQIQIWDSGPGFNFEQHMKTLPKSVPLYVERGRGLWIINQIVDYLNYSQTANQLNCFTIQKNRFPSDESVDGNKSTYQ
ncbi:MAG: ATP-binding protein [Cyanobacteria bacterium J06560_6]